jgi:hypothetical protein
MMISFAPTPIARTARICGQHRSSGEKKSESVLTLRNAPMENEGERWRTLCEQAAKEQDLERLLQLVREINRLLIKRLLREKERGTKAGS